MRQMKLEWTLVLRPEQMELEPLVAMSDELEAEMLQCLEQRAALSPTALPSAAFYTFVNSHHSLNCVTTSSDGACVAGQLTLTIRDPILMALDHLCFSLILQLVSHCRP